MQKLVVDIIRKGALNASILDMIANNNGGKADIDLVDIVGYVKCRAAEFPTIYGDMCTLLNPTEEGMELGVGENGIFSLTIKHKKDDKKQ